MKIDELKDIIVTLRVEGSSAIDHIDVIGLLRIDEDNMQNERVALPELFATFTLLASLAKNNMLDNRLRLETLHAQKIEDIKKDYVAKSSRLPAEKWKIEAEIISSLEYKKIAREYLEAQKQYEIMSGLVESLAVKKDMLMSLAADKRKEMDSY